MRCGILLALISLVAGSAWAQRAVSARAGLIHYVEGRVLVEGERFQPKPAEFLHLNEGELLTTTERGRVEILLNPGTFLRVGENSSVRLLSTLLTDTRVELLSGQALIEVEDLRKDNSILFAFMGSEIDIRKRGLYQLDAADPGLLRVYDGEAHIPAVSPNADPLKVKKGRYMEFDGAMTEAEKFDRDETDALYRWSARRARYIARANVSAARAEGRRGDYGWSFNPVFGMYSFMPASGYGYYSPFGIQVYTPILRPSFSSAGYAGYSGISGRSASAPSAGTAVRSAPAAAPVSAGGRRR